MRKNLSSVSRREVVAYTAGWLALIVALVSPLDALGGALFSAHMTQHEVLMLVAAPLLVLGRPLAPFLLALPADVSDFLINAARRVPLKRAWRVLINPLVAWLIHAVMLWIWHAPLLFQATLNNDMVHAAQHLSFVLSALIFYEAIIFGRDGRRGYGVAIVYLFTTAVHTSVLGALLTFAGTLWYPVYLETTTAWGLTPMEDQQLGGLIMWVPAGVFYIAGGLTLLVLWLRESERRTRIKEKAREKHSEAIVWVRTPPACVISGHVPLSKTRTPGACVPGVFRRNRSCRHDDALKK
jgi:putative membrane protein